MNELPEGWTLVPLGDIAKVEWGNTSITKKSYVTEGYPAFSASGSDGFLSTYEWEGSAVILSAIGARCGKCFYAESKWTAIKNTIVIQGNEQLINHRLLYHYLNDESRWEISGSGQPFITMGKAQKTRYPLAPLNEQRRIVEKLEKLFSRVDAAQARLATIPRILKRFRQSVLAAACSGRLTADWREVNRSIEPAGDLLERINQERLNRDAKPQKKANLLEVDDLFDIPETWSFCLFDDIKAIKPNALKAGPFGSSLTKSCYVPSGYKIYGQEQVIRGDASYGDYYIDEQKFRELQSCAVEAGDLLISLVGTIGKVLIMPLNHEKGIINPRLAKISLHPSIVNSYIENYLTSPIARRILDHDSHGGTMEILNLGMMRKLPIPIPPASEQEEIVRRVKALFKTADALEARYRKAKAHVDKLTQSILAKTFRGELVPQEFNDEPASVLLERIRRMDKEKPSRKTVRPKRRRASAG